MGEALVLIGLLVMFVGFITVLFPIRMLQIPTRGRGALVFLGGVLLLGFGGMLLPPPTASIAEQSAPIEQPVATPSPVERPAAAVTQAPQVKPGVTMVNYQRLQTGMTYEEVVAILGSPGQELSSNEIAGIRTVMYMWSGGSFTGANMNAMFQNDGMVQKAQFGLR
jgi:hypothetical protein